MSSPSVEMMSQISETLTSVWGAASVEASDAPGYYRRRLPFSISLPLYAGIVVPNRARRVSIEFEAEALEGLDLADSTRGYFVEAERDKRRNTVLVHIQETLASMPKDLFRILCEDLLGRMSCCKSSADSAHTLQRRLGHWKSFFIRRSTEGLSYEQYAGLFGEIEFLEKCLKHCIRPMLVSSAWQGPLGANQDFLFGKTAVEVKSVTANNSGFFRVSNIRQLDDVGLELLYLCHTAYDFRENSGRSLNLLITSVRSLLAESPESLVTFDDHLLAAGYVEPDLSAYEKYGFTERQRWYYRVRVGFPRLVESDLPAGVHDVGYSVTLAACSQFAVSETELMNSLPR